MILQIQNIGSVTLNIGHMPFYQLAQVVLGDKVHGKMIFQDLDVRMIAHLL